MILSWFFIYANLLLASSIVSLAFHHLDSSGWSKSKNPAFTIYTSLVFTSLTLLYQPRLDLFLMAFFFTVALLFLIRHRSPNHHWPGLNFYLATYILTFIGIWWGIRFFLSLDVSLVTQTILLSAVPFLAVFIPASAVGLTEQYDILCRKNWLRPFLPYPKRTRRFNPFVTIQVPTHSEPPEVVIATLDKLSRLDYDNFEVMVIDNNTTDPSLWLPVQNHCRTLGRRFRFLHVEDIHGAKAGALNWSHKFLRKKTSILGIIDADYQVEPDFISALVGHFDNSKVGFVQTPHDYRDWQGNAFLSMCYWEYRSFFNTTMISISEKGAGITVGTMCLIRKRALELAGGWSEWCVTEDSELAIRIHKAGYSSIYVNNTYGRGLIPDTFESYKKQRYRWTAGPVQEFLHHYKHLINNQRGSSACSLTQRVYHLHHGIHNTLIGLSIPLFVAGLLAVTSMVWHQEVIPVPIELWLTATITLLMNIVMDILIHKTIIHPNFRQYLGKTIATKALDHTVTIAAFKTLLTGNADWHRTNKFKSRHSYLAAIHSAREELLIGLFLITFIIACFHLLPYHGLALMSLIGIGYVAVNYLSAPVMAIVSAWSLRRNLKPFSNHPFTSIAGI